MARPPDKSYTKGPLDETFGQHAAFPINDPDQEQSEVHLYLQKVRQEALNDRSFYYVEKKPASAIACTTPAETSPPIINESWRNNLMTKFMVLKSSLAESPSFGDTSSIPVPQSATTWRAYVFENPPPSIGFFYHSLDHLLLIKLIVYFTKWLSANIPDTLSQWIFIVFLRLDNVLDSTETSIIRDFGKKARKLADKRTTVGSTVGNYTIDMVLVIVSDYYGQKDILM